MLVKKAKAQNSQEMREKSKSNKRSEDGLPAGVIQEDTQENNCFSFISLEGNIDATSNENKRHASIPKRTQGKRQISGIRQRPVSSQIQHVSSSKPGRYKNNATPIKNISLNEKEYSTSYDVGKS